MGEVGIATPSAWQLNYQNPAFLPFNRVSVFQVGIEMDRRRIATDVIEGKKVTGGLNYLNFAFPVINGKWTTSFGLSPYSTVNTNTFSVNENLGPIDAVATTSYLGQGGLSSLHWANGFFLGKGLYVGMRSSFLFGSIEDIESSSVLDGNIQYYSVTVTDRSSYSGLKNELSLGYRKELTNGNFMNFGLIYQFSKDLKGSRDQVVESTGVEREVVTNERFTFGLPSSIGLGASYQIGRKIIVASDLTFSNWSNAGTEGDNFLNTTKFGIGGEWTPDYASVNNYWKRVSYRVGLSLGQLPYEVSNQAIKEVGINFGASLPVRLSNLDLGFKYGRLGTLNNDLVRETYFRFVIGATINDRWFVKRRYD